MPGPSSETNTMPSNRHPARVQRQRGVTLIIVLMILVVATILGIGGAQIALLGERSTRYDRDYLIASQSAESALMDAEFDIRGPNAAPASRVAEFSQSNTGIFLPDCGTTGVSAGLCESKPDNVKPVWLIVDFLDNTAGTARSVEYGQFTGRQFDAGGAGVKPARKPRYMIETVEDRNPGSSAKYDGSKPPPKMYRVTSMGFGPREDTQVVMQMTYRKEKE